MTFERACQNRMPCVSCYLPPRKHFPPATFDLTCSANNGQLKYGNSASIQWFGFFSLLSGFTAAHARQRLLKLEFESTPRRQKDPTLAAFRPEESGNLDLKPRVVLSLELLPPARLKHSGVFYAADWTRSSWPGKKVGNIYIGRNKTVFLNYVRSCTNILYSPIDSLADW